MNGQETLFPQADDLQALQDFHWSEGLVTSCYLTVDGRQYIGHGDLTTKVNSMVSQARTALERREVSRAARASARRDLDLLHDWVYQNLPQRTGARTLAWFSCAQQGILVTRWLPIGLPDRLVQAEDFDEMVLLGAIRSMPIASLVIIDHASVRYYHADISRVVEIAADAPLMQPNIRAREKSWVRHVGSQRAPLVFGRGNLMEKRLQNRRDHLLYRHIEAVVPRLDRLAKANNWSHLLIAGETKAAAALYNRLDNQLRRLGVQQVDLPAKADSNVIRTFLRDKLDELRRARFEQEYRLIAEQTMPQMRAMRLPDVCAAASVHAIQTLLVEPSPPRGGHCCPQCGFLEANGPVRCRFCQAELISTPHVYDNLSDAVLAAGGDVLLSEKPVLPPAMEHVAARLRFPLTEGL